MDPRVLGHYNRELQYLREMGGEFAREFPKIAGRLGLESLECSDPYVERLLESFAFLAARVQLKIDAEFPRFSQHLLQMVYPHILAPTPSMAVLELQPNLSEGALADGFRVARGTALRSLAGRSAGTACEYRTAHELALWPLELVGAEYTSFLADLGSLRLSGKGKAALRLRLRAAAGLTMDHLALEKLPIFLRGGDEIAMRLYELLMAHTVALVARPGGPGQPGCQVMADASVSPLGFDDDQALLPYGPRCFQGYRLLQEYFAFPSRYMFFDLCGLQHAVRRCTDTELEIIVVFDTQDPRLEKAVGLSQFALFCAPAVNLFPRRADRIHLGASASEYHVVPDRTRPMDFEVHAVTEVVGYGTGSDEKQEFLPLYATNDQSPAAGRAYYTVHRQPRLLSAKQRAQGARSSYAGSEVFLALVDPDEAPFPSRLKQLAVAVTCTNRDLPLHLPLGQGSSDFSLETGAPVAAVRCVAGPTPPRASCAHGDPTWRLISHLSLNYLSLTDAADGGGASALRELLALYGDSGDAVIRRQIEGVRSVASQPVTRRLPLPGPAAFARGTEVTLTCDETAFEGMGVFLLGAVLERFFSKYTSINSFTETALHTVQRGEIARWPARLGRRPLL
ncbi:MAG: type VI secretion system baseplate subunit TssF [Polyangia bacterium]|jgi:type VI secretion system protein ImpG